MTARRSRAAAGLVASLTLVALLLGLFATGASAQAPANPCGPPVVNPIVCENSLPGTPPDQWEIDGAGDSDIQGYATSMSVDVGQTESFKIDTNATAYHIDILRLGYYGGDGARMIQSDVQPSVSLPQTQPSCLLNPGITDANDDTGLIDCGNWSVSASWSVPSTAVSGVYIAHLVIDSPSSEAGDDSQIIFVVRNDASHSNILLSTSDATWEAYNDYGGNSLYTCTVGCPPGDPLAYKAAYAVSYNRPFDGSFTTDGGNSYLYYAEYQMIYWLEENGYDVSYTTDSNLDSNGSLIKNHKIFISSGHDEYWSANERANVQAAINSGVSAAFFSGNEVFWKTRWANSADGSNTPYRTLITYKETHFNAPTDPDDPPTWTGSWIDPRFSPPADGGNPPNSLTGQLFLVNSGTTDIQVPYQYSQARLWRNTAVAALSPGQTLTLDPGAGTLGYEWDADVDNGFRPAGEFDLSSTTANDVQTFTDYGSLLNDPGGCPCNGTETHHLTEYRAPSGALVFGAGTVQWSWGLANFNAWNSSNTEPSGNDPDPTMEQATVNLLADMGAQPTSLNAPDDCPTTSPCLVAASASTVTTPPTSAITAPKAGAQIQDGTAVSVTGTATAASGAVVAGVEISTDGGSTWHPATITSAADAKNVTWSYQWVAHGYPSTTLESRATDDSGNIETPSDATSVDVNCPCSIFGAGTTPQTIDSGDPDATEVGVEFQSSVAGYVTGISFYKASTNTGTHVGSLWTSGGSLLAQATFTNESSSGWQTVTFSTPVLISANTTYMAGYYAPNGHYSDYGYYFYTPTPIGRNAINSPPLNALPANDTGDSNGWFAYSSSPTFPTTSFEGTNYYVDVDFLPAATSVPGQVTGVTATAGPAAATVSWSAPSSGGSPTTYTVTPYIGSTAQATTTVTGVPAPTSATITGLTPGTQYTFTVTASNPIGSGPASAPSAPVTPTVPPVPGAPTGVTASPATQQALVSWTPPTNTGGASLTGYTITPYIGSTAQTPTTVTNGSATSATITGLANGTAYTFKVAASNVGGTGSQSSASNSTTPDDTLFDFSTPSVADSGDASGVELGVKFQSSVAGSVTGIRFYKAATNTGTHVGSLWTSGGSLLASATFSGESASGWQTVLFSSPVSISANTTYVAGYYAPNGHYAAAGSAFTSAFTNGPLSALANGTSANGVYAYGSSSSFPSNSFNSTNYYVDVVFQPPAVPGQVTAVGGTPGPGSASLTWTAPTTGGAATSYTITPYIGSAAQATTTVPAPATSGTVIGLTPGTAYTFTVTASNGSGSGPASAASAPITAGAAVAPGAPTGVTASPATGQALVSWTAPANNGGALVTGYTITPYIGSTAQNATTVSGGSATSADVKSLAVGTAYTFKVAATNSAGTGTQSSASNSTTPADTIFDFATPAALDSGDASGVELGVKFQSSVPGTVTGIRFYKAATNTGTHVGSLWTSGGSLLASATFSGESASGWQTVSFSSPVSISANTTYVAGYYAPNGHYSDAGGAFASVGVSNPPLQALANTTSSDGVYVYGSSSSFPSSSYDSTNYYVDVLFQPPAVPGQVTGVSGTPGPGSASLTWTAPTTGGAATSYTITPYIGSTAQATTTVSAPATSATVTGLTPGTAYTFTVTANDTSGAGPASAQSNSVTPTAATVPGAPTGVTASPASNQALVTWTAPSNNNGGALTGFTITPYIGSTAQTPTTVSGGSATSAIVAGLANGTAYTFKVAATNSAGTGAQSSASNSTTPANTIFDFATPAVVDSGDGSGVELGVQFQSSVAGSVTGIRFYKAATNTGTHVGSLWTSSGSLLASATFSGESASGWQTVSFSSPVSISANTTYVAGYYAPNGHYSYNGGAFASVGVSNPPLQALANTMASDGLYLYGSASAFPTSTFNSTNYYVDVLFQP